MIRVFLADDHPIVREGLKQILSETPDVALVGEADNGLDVLNKATKEKWDILLLDLSLPGKQGIDVLKELQKSSPDLRVLVLSVHPESEYAFRVLKAGAAGYLSKDCIPEMLIYAIRKIHSGGRFVSESLGERLSYLLGGEQKKDPHGKLSDREYQVFSMIAAGKSISIIASELQLSVKTVSVHRSHILKKMKLSSNLDIVRYAIQNDLIVEA
jgi:DNA-binding NarL/FixJ family response regulator